MDWADEKYDVSAVQMHMQMQTAQSSDVKKKKEKKKIIIPVFVWLQKLLIAQVKMVLKVLFLYIPLPMFWALFDQQVTTNPLSSTLHSL